MCGFQEAQHSTFRLTPARDSAIIGVLGVELTAWRIAESTVAPDADAKSGNSVASRDALDARNLH